MWIRGVFVHTILKAIGKEASSFIRINGTSRPADIRTLQELEMEGQRIYYDSMQEIGMEYDEEKALKGKSKCRNAAISEAFYYMGIIEGWGTGLERIQKSCREYGLKKPMIEEFGNGFRVVLFRKTVNGSQEVRKKFDPVGIEAGTDGTKAGTNDIKIGTNGTQSSVNIRNQIELSEDELLIIDILKNKPLTTQPQLKEFTGIPLRTVKRMMSRLQKKGILTRAGSNRSGKWEIRE